MIIITNGQGNSGKDTTQKYITKYLNTNYPEKEIIKLSIIDPIKDVAETLGWTGGKSLIDRKFLSDLKELTDQYNDFSMNYLVNLITQLHNDNAIIFIDMRSPSDISRFKKIFIELPVYTLLIKGKTPLYYGNEADDNVFQYEYDYIINNDSTLQGLNIAAIEFIEKLLKEDKQ